jgi:quinolinate synthase
MSQDLLEYISNRKKELKAIIMAHYYQPPEIQDAADFIGDSLQLARQASETDAEVIIFCGVKFMAESAKILSPEKTVILPEINAGCPMADMITAAALREMKSRHPGAVVVCYVNSSAEVKAESDICCTSSNAINVVKSIPQDKEIIFVPDKNLGTHIQDQTGRKMILWEGFCPVHNLLTREELKEQLALHPGAKVVVHPECIPDITRSSDAVRSTAGILNYVQASPEKDFIIGTEEGFTYTLENNCPEKNFYLARLDFQCRDMKYISLSSLARSMEKLQYRIELPEETREKAHNALQKMLSIN